MRAAIAGALATCLLLLTSTPAVAQETEALPARSPEDGAPLEPDIFLVMLDDLGYLEDERVLERLPAIRDLWLEEGVRFRQMHDESPLCGPSRASLLTGQHTLHHGVTKNDTRPFDPAKTIAPAMQGAGYHTLQVGKYFVGHDGADVPPGWDRTFTMQAVRPASFWKDGRLVRRRGQHADDVTRKQARRWVRAAPADRPLFAWVSMHAPHVDSEAKGQAYLPPVMDRDKGAPACRDIESFKPPTYATDTNRREVREMPYWPRGWRLRRTCESLLVVDRAVRDLRAAQEERGRPAWFFLVSDNGMSWGQKGFSFKHSPPSTRAPFYAAGPGVAAGSTDVLVSKIDVAPTIAAIAGAELPAADGMSLLPLLQGNAFEGRGEHLEVMPRSNARSYEGWNALRTPEHRFIRWDDGQRELYDLEADPWEQDDLSADESEMSAAMEARLDELLAASASTGDELAPARGS